jgi:pantothenate synthetase
VLAPPDEEVYRAGHATWVEVGAVVETAADARIDYIALVDPQTLAPVGELRGRTLAALAVWIENTRLIDNCFLEPTDR